MTGCQIAFGSLQRTAAGWSVSFGLCRAAAARDAAKASITVAAAITQNLPLGSRRVDRQMQFGVVDQPILRLLPGQARAVVQDHGNAFAAPVHDVRAISNEPGFVRSGALGEQAAHSLVTSRLPIAEAVDGQGICNGARRVDLQAILEQPQSNLGPVHGVIPMGDGIRHGLEYRSHVVLRSIGSAHRLEGCGRHVLGDEAAGFHDLPVQRSRHVCSVELIGGFARAGADLVTPVGDRLHVGVGKPAAGILAPHQHAGDRRPQCSLFRRAHESQLAEKGVPIIVGAWCPKPLPQIGRQVLDAGTFHNLLIEPDEPGLAALLEHPGEVFGGHGPLGIRHAVEESAGASVDEQTTRNLHLHHCHVLPNAGGKPKPIQDQVLYRRVDRSRAHFLDEIDYRVETLSRNADDIARMVFDAEHEHAAAAVCECRHLISDGIWVRTGDAVTGEADFLEFEKRALAEANPVEQLLCAIEHASAPAPAADNRVPMPRDHLPSPDKTPCAAECQERRPRPSTVLAVGAQATRENA